MDVGGRATAWPAGPRDTRSGEDAPDAFPRPRRRAVAPSTQASSSGGARRSRTHARRVSPRVVRMRVRAAGQVVGGAGAPAPAAGRAAGLVLDPGSAGVRDPGSLALCGPAACSLQLLGTPPLRSWRVWGALCTLRWQERPRGPASGSPPWSRCPAPRGGVRLWVKLPGFWRGLKPSPGDGQKSRPLSPCSGMPSQPALGPRKGTPRTRASHTLAHPDRPSPATHLQPGTGGSLLSSCVMETSHAPPGAAPPRPCRKAMV